MHSLGDELEEYNIHSPVPAARKSTDFIFQKAQFSTLNIQLLMALMSRGGNSFSQHKFGAAFA